MKKHLGQHFLINSLAINKIVSALDIQPNETIIEIGPGEGALTLPLAKECAEKNCRLIAIEKDEQLVQELKNHLRFSEDVNIINGDVLKILPKLLTSFEDVNIGNWKLVGNIPYYITGKLLRTISELKNKPVLTVLMIQKEVAERIMAVPPKNNLLASAVKIWAEPKIIFKLKPSDFSPAPKVNSAVIQLTTNDKQLITQKEKKKYYELIHIIFKQPRKTLINNLKELNPAPFRKAPQSCHGVQYATERCGINIEKNKLENIIKSLNLSQNCRPQDLSIENILNILKML